MNIDRIRLLQAAILAEPQNYEQDTYGATFPLLALSFSGSIGSAARRILEEQHQDNGQLSAENPVCGTACCLAGMSVALSNREMYKSYAIDSAVTSMTIFETARAWLDLNPCQATTLFASSDVWPSEYKDRYNDSLTLQARAQVGADMIDYVIENASELPPSQGGDCPDFSDDYYGDDYDDEDEVL